MTGGPFMTSFGGVLNNPLSTTQHNEFSPQPSGSPPPQTNVRRSSFTPAMPSESSILRNEQDYLYQESLKQDQEKEEQRRIEQQKKDDVELWSKLQDAFSEHQQEEKEKEKAVKREQSVPSEPSENEAGVTALQIRLPDGNKVLRRFRQDEQLQVVMNFVTTLPKSDFTSENCVLATPFPSQTFTDLSKTLKQVALFPRAVLLVQKK